MPGLLDHRLLFVTGKGGVGRSTVAMALGLLAAQRGLRTIVAELSNQVGIQRAFGRRGEQFEEVELAPGLFAISIDPQHAMEEYLRVKAGALGVALGHSRMFGVFAMATPGMRELLSIGKVWELAQDRRRSEGAAAYDLVIVDAPATGHGVGLLRTPRTFAEIARVGPIAAQGNAIAETLADRLVTGVVAVALPEEMPVSETVELGAELHADGLALDAVIVNGVYPRRFDESDLAALSAVADGDGDGDGERPTRGAARAAVSAHARARTQGVQLARLREELDARVIELPFLFCEELGRGELEALAEVLAQALAETSEREPGPDSAAR